MHGYFHSYCLYNEKRGFLGVKQRINKERAQLRRIRIVTLCLAGILVFVGVFAQTAIKNRASMTYKTVDTVFNDPDKFKEYMETPKPFPQWLSSDEVEIIKQERSEDFTIVYENGDITSMTEQPVGDGATSEYKYESGDEWVIFRWLNNEVEDYDITIEENGEFVVTTYLYNKNERNLGAIEDISFMAGYVYYPLSIIIPIIVYYLLCRKNGLIKNKPKKESPMQK